MTTKTTLKNQKNNVMKTQTNSEHAAKKVGAIINLVITFAGGAFVVYGIALWAIRYIF